MKKRLLNWAFKLLIVLIFASLTISVVVLSMALYETYNTKKDLEKELSYADESQSSYQGTVDEFEDQIESLTKQNERLMSISRENTGVIRGEVAQIITESGSLGDYQIVCAQSTTNSSELYCVSIPSVKKAYSLIVPVGTYIVFATPLDSSTLGTKNKAYYSEFVKCLQSSNECDSKKNTPVNLKIEEGSSIENVDPVDLN